MPPLPKRKLVVLEDSTVVSMALNAAIVKELPFLAGIAAQARTAGGKKSCGGCRANANRTTYDSAKTAIAGLDSTKKRKLKELMNAERLRVTYRLGNKVQVLTF